MSTEAFPFLEDALAADLGVPRRKLRDIRSDELEQKIDWDVVAGAVHLSQVGRAKVFAALKIILPEASSAAAEKISPESSALGAPAERAAGTLETLTCHKCYKPNRHIVEAKTAAAELVLVRVKDNTNLQPGMAMKCRFAGGRMWELAQRLPRHRGRW